MAKNRYVLNKGDLLYDHLVTYSVGLISLASLHHEEIRKQIIDLPEIVMDGTIHEKIYFPLEQFRPWLRNLDKAANQEYLVRYTIWIAEKALAASYEDVIKSHKDDSQLMEFYRHIRNGVSHGNKFNIQISEKKRKKENITDSTNLATWRNKEIKLKLQDATVIPKYLTLGDIFVLMSDMNEYLMKKTITE